MLTGFISRTGRACRVGAAGLIMLGLSVSSPGQSEPPAASPAPSPSITIVLEGADYAQAREALLDAIAEDGLTAPMISDFGAMLKRTAADLGHSDALYAQAEIFIFCSIAVAARLATEARDNISQCPLSIALYTVAEPPKRVFMTYRLPQSRSPGSQMAAETLARITARARDQTFP